MKEQYYQGILGYATLFFVLLGLVVSGRIENTPQICVVVAAWIGATAAGVAWWLHTRPAVRQRELHADALRDSVAKND